MGKYESYQETPYTWLPEVPNHWSAKTIRSITKLSNERCGDRKYTLLSVYREYGVIQKASRDDNRNVESEDLSNYKVVVPGDLVLNKMKMWQGSLGVSKYQGIVSPAYIVCNVIDHTINSTYLHILLRSMGFKTYYNQFSYGVRVGQWDMHYDDFKKLIIYLPPREEQNQIVLYLDWQTSKINKLISAKKKQIELLQEAKYAFVSDLISHGLKHCTLKKDSNVSWLGTIPAHWSTVKLRNILTPVSIKNCSDMQLLSVVREKGVIVRDTEDQESNRNFIPDDLSGYKRVLKNQFVINKMKAWQGSYGISEFDGIVSPAYFVFDIHFKNFEYFHYAIRSKIYVNFFAQASAGIRVGQWDLSIDKMREIPFILPPEDEQVQIVKAIKIHTQKVDIALGKLKKEIECLLEFRNKIISDVVTGQIDVRSIKVPDFELVEEMMDDADIAEDVNVEEEE